MYTNGLTTSRVNTAYVAPPILDLNQALDRAKSSFSKAYDIYENFEDYYFQKKKASENSLGIDSYFSSYLENVDGDALNIEEFKALAGLNANDVDKEFLVIRYDRLYSDLNKMNLNIQEGMTLLLVIQQVSQIISKQAAKLMGDVEAARESNEQHSKASSIISTVLKKAVSSYQEFMGNFEEAVQEYNYTLYQAKLESITEKYSHWSNSVKNWAFADESQINKIKEQQAVNQEYGEASAKSRDFVLAAKMVFSDSSLESSISKSYLKLTQNDGETYKPTTFDPQEWKKKGAIPVGLKSFASPEEEGANYFRADLELVAKAKKNFNAIMAKFNLENTVQILVMQVLDNAIVQMEQADYGTGSTATLEQQYERLESQLSTAQARMNKAIDKNKELTELVNQQEKIRIQLVKLGEGAGPKGFWMRVMGGLKNWSFLGLGLAIFMPFSAAAAGVGLFVFGFAQATSELVKAALEKSILDETNQKQNDARIFGDDLADFMRVFGVEEANEYSIQAEISRLSQALLELNTPKNSEQEQERLRHLEAVKQAQKNQNIQKVPIESAYAFLFSSTTLSVPKKSYLQDSYARFQQGIKINQEEAVNKIKVLKAEDLAFSEVPQGSSLGLAEKAQNNMVATSNRLDNLMLEFHQLAELDFVESIYDTQLNSKRSASIFLKKGAEKLTVNQAKMAEIQDQIRFAQEKFRMNWLVIKNITDTMSALAALLGEKQKRVINHHLEKQLNYRLSLYNDFIGLMKEAMNLRLSAHNHNIEVDKTRFNANANLVFEGIKMAAGAALFYTKQLWLIEPMRVLTDYVKKEILFNFKEILGVKTYSLTGVKAFNREAMDAAGRYSPNKNLAEIRKQPTILDNRFDLGSTAFSTAFHYHDEEVDQILAEAYHADESDVFIEDGKRFLFGFNSQLRDPNSKVTSFQVNLKYFQDMREKIKGHYMKVYAQQVAAMVHNQMLKKLVSFESGIQREYSTDKVFEIMERDRDRAYTEFTEIIKQFQEEAADRKALFDKVFDMEKSQLTVMMIAGGFAFKKVLNQHSFLKGNWAQIKNYGDMIHGYHSAYLWGSQNKLQSFLEDHESISDSDLNRQNFQNIKNNPLRSDQEFQEDTFPETRSLDEIRRENLKKWNIQLGGGNESVAFETLGWSYRMMNYMEFTKTNLEVRKSVWQIKKMLIPVLEEAEMISNKARLNGANIAQLSHSSFLYSSLEFEKAIALEQRQSQFNMYEAYKKRFMDIQQERLETGMQTLALVIAPYAISPFARKLFRRNSFSRGYSPSFKLFGKFTLNTKRWATFQAGRNLLYYIFLEKLIHFYRTGFYLLRAETLKNSINDALKTEHKNKLVELNNVDLNQHSKPLSTLDIASSNSFVGSSFEQDLYDLKMTKGFYVSSDDSFTFITSLYKQMVDIVTTHLVIDYINRLRNRMNEISSEKVYNTFGAQAFQRIVSGTDLKDANEQVKAALKTLVASLSFEKSSQNSLQKIGARSFVKGKQLLNFTLIPLVGSDYLKSRSIESRVISKSFEVGKNELLYGFGLNSKLLKQEKKTRTLVAKAKDINIKRILENDLKLIEEIKLDLKALGNLGNSVQFSSLEIQGALTKILAKLEGMHKNQSRIEVLRYSKWLRSSNWSLQNPFKKQKLFNSFNTHLRSALIRIQLAEMLSFQKFNAGVLNPEHIKQLNSMYANLNALKENKAAVFRNIVAEEFAYMMTQSNSKNKGTASSLFSWGDSQSQYFDQLGALLKAKSNLQDSKDFEDKHKESLNEILAYALIGTGKDLKNKIRFLEHFNLKNTTGSNKELANLVLGLDKNSKGIAEYSSQLLGSSANFANDAHTFSKYLFKYALKNKWFDVAGQSSEEKIKVQKKLGHSIAAITADNKVGVLPDYYTHFTKRMHHFFRSYRPGNTQDLGPIGTLRYVSSHPMRWNVQKSFHRVAARQIEAQAAALMAVPEKDKGTVLKASLALYEGLYLVSEERSFVHENLNLPMVKLKDAINSRGGKTLLRDLESSNKLNNEDEAFKNLLNKKDPSPLLAALETKSISIDLLAQQKFSELEMELFAKKSTEQFSQSGLIKAIKEKGFGLKGQEIFTQNVFALGNVLKKNYQVNLIDALIFKGSDWASIATQRPLATMKSLIENKPLLFESDDMQAKLMESFWVSVGNEMGSPLYKLGFTQSFLKSFTHKMIEGEYKFDKTKQQDLLVKFLIDKPDKLMRSIDRNSAKDVVAMFNKKKSMIIDLYNQQLRKGNEQSEFLKYFQNSLATIRQEISGDKNAINKLNQKIKQMNQFYSLAETAANQSPSVMRMVQAEKTELFKTLDAIKVENAQVNFQGSPLEIQAFQTDPFELLNMMNSKEGFDHGKQLIDQMINWLKVASYTIDFYAPEPDRNQGSWSFK